VNARLQLHTAGDHYKLIPPVKIGSVKILQTTGYLAPFNERTPGFDRKVEAVYK
jgi:hypothetical protein